MPDLQGSARRSAQLGMMIALLAVAGCGSSKEGKNGRGQNGPATVGYVVMQPTAVADVTELSGRTTAFQMSEVRPQVTGLIRRRLFREGALVRQGQPLFQIDPSLYRAAANQATREPRRRCGQRRGRADQVRPLPPARRDGGGVEAGLHRRAAPLRARRRHRSRRTARRWRPRGSTCASRPSLRRSPAGSGARCSPRALW